MITSQSKIHIYIVAQKFCCFYFFFYRTSITVFRHSNVNPWSRFRSDHCGLLLDFSFVLPQSINNSFQYELGVKEIFASNKQTPFFIRQQCGPRVSSVFRHIASYDTRDDSVFPTQGVFARTTSEIIGDRLSQYGAVKSDSHVEMNVPLFAGMSLQLCGRLGKIIENPKVMRPLSIDSLFFLGGPQSLRGFDGSGATTVQDGVARGSRVYWATGIHLWTPLPFNRYFGGFGDLFRTHFFYNFGNCETLSLGKFRTLSFIHICHSFNVPRQLTDCLWNGTGIKDRGKSQNRVQLLLSTRQAKF